MSRVQRVLLIAHDRWLPIALMLTALLCFGAFAVWAATDDDATVTVSNSAVSLTSGQCAVSGSQGAALIQVKTAGIYYTLTSATATPASTDFEATPGTTMRVARPDRLRMIRSGTVDASVKVSCLIRNDVLFQPPSVTVMGSALSSATDSVGVVASPALAPCKTQGINRKGTAGADITADATAGGITVADADATRCGLMIINTSANPMRCGPTGQTITATTWGVYIPATPGFYNAGLSGQQAWKCIRTGGSSATANVVEELP